MWKTAALAALTACGLAYEVALPLLAANQALLVLVWRSRRDAFVRHGTGPGFVATSVAVSVLVLAAVLALKVSTAVGAGYSGDYLDHLVRLGAYSTWTQFGSYGLALPSTGWWAPARVSRRDPGRRTVRVRRRRIRGRADAGCGVSRGASGGRWSWAPGCW